MSTVTRADQYALTELLHVDGEHTGSPENCACERLAYRISRVWAEALPSHGSWHVIRRQNLGTFELHPANPAGAARTVERLVQDGVADAVPADLTGTLLPLAVAAAAAGFTVVRLPVTYPTETATWAARVTEEQLTAALADGAGADQLDEILGAAGAELSSVIVARRGVHAAFTAAGEYISSSRDAFAALLGA